MRVSEKFKGYYERILVLSSMGVVGFEKCLIERTAKRSAVKRSEISVNRIVANIPDKSCRVFDTIQRAHRAGEQVWL